MIINDKLKYLNLYHYHVLISSVLDSEESMTLNKEQHAGIDEYR